MIGSIIDRYQVIEKLGEGGMGVVYRARDTLLHRQVALKVLPPDHLADPQRRERFIREAKLASALNHPGIVAIHDVLRSNGQDVIVMELVDGQTLQQILAERRLTLNVALGHAIDIAGAVARAHAAGIVHRDLKPSNVMVTPEGAIKILDFGLAKQIAPDLIGEDAPTLTAAEAPLTGTRVIAGTLLYMSPEQASARPIDARSDVFTFGVITYEMLTGRHPFRRASNAESLRAIIESEPDAPSQVNHTLPRELDRAVLRCLRKEPRQRWQSLSDLEAVLEDIREDSAPGRRSLGGTSNVKPWRARYPMMFGAAAAAILLALFAVVYGWLRTGATSARPPMISRLTYDGGFSGLPGISYDGKLIAYASDRSGEGNQDIWVRYINRPAPARLTSNPADDTMPNLSPDGSRIVFRSTRDGGGIYVVNTLGGGERRIAGDGVFPRYSPDGSSIVYIDQPQWAPEGLLRMFLVSTDGGHPRPFLPEYGVLPTPESVGAIWSPDGRYLMFRGAAYARPADRDWWVVPVEGGEPSSTGINEAFPRIDVIQFPCAWLPGRVLFAAGTTIEGINLYTAAISAEGRIKGPPRTLTTGPGISMMPTVSGGGRVALSRLQWLVNLWQVELDAASGRPRTAPQKVGTSPAPKLSFSPTRDGSRLAFSVYSGTPGRHRAEIVEAELPTGPERTVLMSKSALASLHPQLSPDGSLLSWVDVREGHRVTLLASVDEMEAEPQRLCEDCVVHGFTSDGSSVLVQFGSAQLALQRISDGRVTELVSLAEGALLDADLSWDDRWLAVCTGRPNGRAAIEVLPVLNHPVPRDRWIRVSAGKAWVSAPRWSPDGRFLYHISDRDGFTCIWAFPLDAATRQPTGEPFAVVHAHSSAMSMQMPARWFSTLAVARGRLVFNAAATSGEVYTMLLDNSRD